MYFVNFTFLLRLDSLAGHLAMIDAIECEMDCSKASAPEAMRCDGILSDYPIPAPEGC